MAMLTIRNLDDDLKSRLRIRAARHDHSMEEEARSILRTALSESENLEESIGIGIRIRNRLTELGGVELDRPQRTSNDRLGYECAFGDHEAEPRTRRSSHG